MTAANAQRAIAASLDRLRAEYGTVDADLEEYTCRIELEDLALTALTPAERLEYEDRISHVWEADQHSSRA